MKFLSLANTFCSVEKPLSAEAVVDSDVEVNCKQPVKCWSPHVYYFRDVIVLCYVLNVTVNAASAFSEVSF